MASTMYVDTHPSQQHVSLNRAVSFVTLKRINQVKSMPDQQFFQLKNGWLKYDHRVMYKKYTSPLPYLWDVGK